MRTRQKRLRTLTTKLRYLFMGLMLLAGLPFLQLMGCGGESWEDGADESATPDASDKMTATSSTTYHLPLHSGDVYRATTYSGHNAWDFNLASGASDCGEPVVAVTNGWIVGAVNTVDYNCYPCSTNPGNYVKLDHDVDSNVSHYYHLKDVYVRSGQWVERGQVLGTIGNTGNAQGCHLHYEVRNASNAQITMSLAFYYNGGQSTLVNNGVYTSVNRGKIDGAASRNGGSAKVGWPSSSVASRVDYDGYATYYSGGSFGNCAIYYQALGCGGGDYCPSYNNTNFAWLVRTGFYNWYYSCGGPKYCWLGFPTGDEVAVSGGAKQTFEFGYLMFNSSSGQITAYHY